MENANVHAGALRRVDLSRATGCNLETIRYYENIGVLPQPPRSANGYRCYDNNHLARLHFVMRSRELGFSLDEIRGLLALVDGGIQTCAEVRNLANDHVSNVRKKISDLRRIETVLSETMAKCSGKNVPECAVIDALSVAPQQ